MEQRDCPGSKNRKADASPSWPGPSRTQPHTHPTIPNRHCPHLIGPYGGNQAGPIKQGEPRQWPAGFSEPLPIPQRPWTVRFTSSYHPQANGQVEHHNQELVLYLRTYCCREQQRSSKLIPGPSTHKILCLTPFQSVLGYQSPLFLVRGTPWASPE